MPECSTDEDGFIPLTVRHSLESLLAFLAEPTQKLPPSILRERELAQSWLDAISGRKQRVDLGRVCATPGALTKISEYEIAVALMRHQSGDWGSLDIDDWQENDRSLRDGYRLLSAYHSVTGTRFWIITEADRSVTTALLPDEY